MWETYSAYCITPFLGSWLASGKLVGSVLGGRALPVGWTWPPAAEALCWWEEEMEAAARRKGTRAVVGLAVAGLLVSIVHFLCCSGSCPFGRRDPVAIATYLAGPARPTSVMRSTLWLLCGVED